MVQLMCKFTARNGLNASIVTRMMCASKEIHAVLIMCVESIARERRKMCAI